MNWIENVRQKPPHEKIKLIWVICGIVVVILVVTWILIGGIKHNTKKDLRFFDSLKASAKNFGQTFQGLQSNK